MEKPQNKEELVKNLTDVVLGAAQVKLPLGYYGGKEASVEPEAAAVFILFRTEYETHGLPVAAHPTLDAAKADAEVREHGKRLEDRSYSWEVDKGAYWPWKTPRNWTLRPTRKEQEHWWTIYKFALSLATPAEYEPVAWETRFLFTEDDDVGPVGVAGWSLWSKCSKPRHNTLVAKPEPAYETRALYTHLPEPEGAREALEALRGELDNTYSTYRRMREQQDRCKAMVAAALASQPAALPGMDTRCLNCLDCGYSWSDSLPLADDVRCPRCDEPIATEERGEPTCTCCMENEVLPIADCPVHAYLTEAPASEEKQQPNYPPNAGID